ncbi:MAG: bifunctional DNA-formamidopyrimidine glycosylase/DNA-(apurinic or apyrimidinic site) lyase [Halopseudomonas sp.]
MPELPEVETTRRGIEPHVKGRRVTAVVVRQPRLRWPIPVEQLVQRLVGQRVESVERRAKYLLLKIGGGYLIVHLGMSGSLRLVAADAVVGKHDHFDLCLDTGFVLRLTDPRRFGAVLWHQGVLAVYPLLAHLGPEPLTDDFDGERLFKLSRKKRQAVKLFIMDNRTVVGVGNIYANEALFEAGIDPRRAAGRISLACYQQLAQIIKEVLDRAIKQGGTTLKDFVGGDGKPGYFQQQLQVYGRGGEECCRCGAVLQEVRLGQRASVFCAQCQR